MFGKQEQLHRGVLVLVTTIALATPSLIAQSSSAEMLFPAKIQNYNALGGLYPLPSPLLTPYIPFRLSFANISQPGAGPLSSSLLPTPTIPTTLDLPRFYYVPPYRDSPGKVGYPGLAPSGFQISSGLGGRVVSGTAIFGSGVSSGGALGILGGSPPLGGSIGSIGAHR